MLTYLGLSRTIALVRKLHVTSLVTHTEFVGTSFNAGRYLLLHEVLTKDW